MKILILEDSSKRIAWFSEEFKEYDLVIANNSSMAIDILKTMNFDLAMLDHDLGQKIFAKSDKNSGFAVAEEIPKNPESVKNVIVHSYNPEGSIRMMKVFEKCGIKAYQMPYGTFDKSVLN